MSATALATPQPVPATDTMLTVNNIEVIYDHVILVLPDDDVSDALLYIGVSRAISGLTIVGPEAVRQRLGLS